jgi:hypothetical protein
MKPIAVLTVLMSAACTAATPQPPPVVSTGSTGPTVPTVDAAIDPNAPMRPIHGNLLEGRTGLRVVAAGSGSMAVLDVDRESVQPITGPPRSAHCSGPAIPVGTSLAVTAGCRVYVIRTGSLRAEPLATGEAVAATYDRRGVWVVTTPQRGKCALGAVSLDGRVLARRIPVDCQVRPWAATPIGLLVENTVRLGGKTVFRGDAIVQVIGRRVLTAEYGKPLRLTDVDTGKATEIPAPTQVGTASIGKVSPDGRWIAISYESPAWPGPRQRMDVWLLDTRSLRWSHVPSMPVPVTLKATDLAWSPDGRLVMLGTFDATGDKDMQETIDILAVWRPGERQLRVRRIQLPADHSAGIIAVR